MRQLDQTVFTLKRNSRPHTLCFSGCLTHVWPRTVPVFSERSSCVRQCCQVKADFSVSSLDSRYRGYRPRARSGCDLDSGEVRAEFMGRSDDPETRGRGRCDKEQPGPEQVAKHRERHRCKGEAEKVVVTARGESLHTHIVYS